ncbi:MAG: hypothetical protein ACI9SQ_000482, partial [Rubritalea sp.]
NCIKIDITERRAGCEYGFKHTELAALLVISTI